MTTQALRQRNISNSIQKSTQAIQSFREVPAKKYVRTSRMASRTVSRSSAIAMVDVHRNTLATTVIGLFCISLCLYLYMVVSIVLATVDRRRVEEQVRNQSTELSAIESDYGQAIGRLTLGEVKALGFVDAGEASFAVRDTLPTFTLRNE